MADSRGRTFTCIRCEDLFTYFWRGSPEEVEQRHKSRQIDKTLKREDRARKRQVKVLLLGAGESGKSTFLKQMRIIHGVNFEPELVREYQHVIYQNLVKGMQVLVDAREILNIPWSNPKRQYSAHKILDIQNVNELDIRLFRQCAPVISDLWQDKAIKDAFDRRREFQISDSVSYFMNEIDRIEKPDYVPTAKDILYCRKATKGVHEFTIRIENIPFVFVDVGGQRSQRRKWIKCFEDKSVNSILFLVSTSEFDQVLAEDRTTNRLEESKNIFDTIVNNKTFEGISIILFLNKADLLEQKILSKSALDISHYYPQFKGNPNNLLDVHEFISNMFLNVRRNCDIAIYHHFTTAVDTNNIQHVFRDVKANILNNNLIALNLH
ncbi:hypothetical protein HA402_004351 [Bradysia odoriphaga]|nr:hypothetical protein HA402_004351 [Bradysia odoriphaga]